VDEVSTDSRVKFLSCNMFKQPHVPLGVLVIRNVLAEFRHCALPDRRKASTDLAFSSTLAVTKVALKRH
jgi:hypothetical protein